MIELSVPSTIPTQIGIRRPRVIRINIVDDATD